MKKAFEGPRTSSARTVMIDPAQNPALQRAIRLALTGIGLVCAGIVWVFLRPEGAMFGLAEVVTVAGMLMIMTAAWKAAEATADGD